MRLRSRIKSIEGRLRPTEPIWIVAHSENEADEQIRNILKDNPDARIGSVLIAPRVNKPANAGM